MTVTFKQVDSTLAIKLLAFVDRRNIGPAIKIDGVDYKMDYISQNSSAFFKSRGMSVYFLAEGDVIRISDHWAFSNFYPRSHKLNCISVSGHRWGIDNSPDSKLYCLRYTGRFPFEMLAGRASLEELSQSCDHWRNALTI